jgi:hypothetical protein
MSTWLKLTILGVLIVGIIVLFHYCQSRHTSPVATMGDINKIASIKADSTAYWKDQFNQEHAAKEQAEGNITEIMAEYQSQIDGVSLSLKVKEQEIKNLTSFNVVRRVNLDSLVKHDTTYIPGVDGRIDTVIVVARFPQYAIIRDSLQIVQYLKKTGWFTHTPYIDVVDFTGDSKITNIQGFSIKDPQPKIVPAFGGALIYTGSGKWSPALGAGFQTHVWKIPFSFYVMTSL